jgi:class 3 adenylate cyclase
MNWRGRPPTSHQVIVAPIGATTTRTGVRVRAELDQGRSPLGTKVRDAELAAVPLARHGFHGAWNSTHATGSSAGTSDGKVVEHDPGGLEVTSLRQRLRRGPAPVLDAGLAVALAVATTIGIRVAPGPGTRPDAVAYALGLTIAALALARRRWPLAVLLASSATLQLYYLSQYTSTYPAVPLSVALATAWAAGHRRWSLLVAAWYVIGPLAYAISRLSQATRTPLTLLGDAVSNAALFAAVLVLGEAVRSRRALQLEQDRSERLLLNVLPAPIAARLKAGEEVIADAFPDVTVLFADLVDFTRRSQRTSPAQVVAALNELFSAFDRLTRRQGVEKIKTIGDAYMVAGGLPTPRPDHAEAVAELALAMQAEVARRADPSGQPLAVRIGIDTGPVEAGVIGTSKFSYDLWGDTVNTASRMESHGVAGCIQVTERTYQRLRDGYRFQRRGPIPVRGKGEMVTYFLVGRNR